MGTSPGGAAPNPGSVGSSLPHPTLPSRPKSAGANHNGVGGGAGGSSSSAANRIISHNRINSAGGSMGSISSQLSGNTPSATSPNLGSTGLSAPPVPSGVSLLRRKSSNLQINIKRRFSGDVSPVQSGGALGHHQNVGNSWYSNLTPSPAVSFLSSLAENMATALPPRGVYFEGDQIGDWLLVREIGRGSFSRVFEAVPADPALGTQRVAIKVIRKVDETGGQLPSMMLGASADDLLSTSGSSSRSNSMASVASSIASSPPGHQSLGRSSVSGAGAHSSHHYDDGYGGGYGGHGVAHSMPNPHHSMTLSDRAQHGHHANGHGHHGSSNGSGNGANGHGHNNDVAMADAGAETGDSGSALDDVQRLLDHETSIWGSLQHPNIIAMYDVMEVPDAMFVVSELASGGTLLDYLGKRGKLDEMSARVMFRQIADAVRYMHTVAGVVHRDIKCENILLVEPQAENDEDNSSNSSLSSSSNGGGGMMVGDKSSEMLLSRLPIPKIADFGLSDRISTTGSTSPPMSPGSLAAADPIFCMGSLHYCAPEELRATMVKSPASDVWSLGCVLYAMLTGSLAFSDDFLPRLQLSIINGRYDVHKLERCGVSKDGRDLVAGMFKVKVEGRLSINDVCEHKWLKG
ncbi:Testis-specific serine/threonine-protein kinase 3 [Blyttiomyces sp. JEL0837]|nr:Testis-specific serine/threonine-protein kinase 3 [Blyttiomyces sp. JEL0837]